MENNKSLYEAIEILATVIKLSQLDDLQEGLINTAIKCIRESESMRNDFANTTKKHIKY